MKTKRMLSYSLITLVLIAFVLGTALAWTQPAAAATGQICDQYGSTTQGNYIIMNNRWGTTATQCVNVTTNGFTLQQMDGNCSTSGAPCSYPAIYVGCHYSNCSPSTNLPMQISAISSANTSVSVTYPGSGTYDAAYDIWLNADTNVTGVQDTEIMIWLNHTGSIQPIGSNTGTVTLGGQSWAVWVGNNGANNVVSYEGSGITSFNTDVKPFLLDAMTRGSGFGTTSWYLTSMQMGFEPWSGGAGLAVNSFSSAVSSGGSNPTNTPVTPVPPTATATTSVQTNPIVWYKFDETSGTSAADSSGNGKTATLVNGSTWVGGKLNNAVDINGGSQHVSLPSGIVNGLTNFTIASWVKLDTTASWARLFDFGNNTTSYMFLAPQSGSGAVRFAITTSGGGGEQQINGSSALSTGVWHHVAVTLSGSTGTLYVDGAQVGQNTSMSLNPASMGSTSNNWIGRSQWSDPYLDGQVDDFRIYNRALSASEVQGLYGTTTTPTPTPSGPTPTPVPTGGTCSPVTSSITAPFTYDGAGTFCWQSSNLGSYVNSWNTTSVSINGTNYTNVWVAAGSLPAKVNGYWYVSYNSTVGWAHFEAK